MITKGAAEEVLERCTKVYDLVPCGDDASSSESKTASDDKPFSTPSTFSTAQPLDDDIRNSLTLTAESLNSQGLRVIAVATKLFTDLPCDTEKNVEVVFEERELVFVIPCFPRPDAAEAIEQLKKLGVKVSLCPVSGTFC
jgi:P-type Mg2+ transporter